MPASYRPLVYLEVTPQIIHCVSSNLSRARRRIVERSNNSLFTMKRKERRTPKKPEEKVLPASHVEGSGQQDIQGWSQMNVSAGSRTPT